MTTVELRVRSDRLPESFGGELRVFVGRSEKRADVKRYRHQRGVLRKLVARGQWDVLEGIKAGRFSVEQVTRVVDETGMDTLHLELRDPGTASPLGELVPRFLASLEQEGTRLAYRTDLNRLLAHVGEGTQWSRVGRHEINDLLDQMREAGLSAATLGRSRTAWSAFFTWAMDRDASEAEKQGRALQRTDHPVRTAKDVHRETTRHRFLSPEELDRLLDASSPQMRPQYLTLAYTGMRIGEFMSRLPGEIDLGRRLIRILPRPDWKPKGWPRYKHGMRNVPVHRKRLLPALEWYRDELAGEEAFFVGPRTFRPWTYHGFRLQLQRDCIAAGLVYGRDDSQGITAHTFRHSLASWLAQRDVQLKKIARILGDTTKTVERYYSHLLPSDLDQTLNEVISW